MEKITDVYSWIFGTNSGKLKSMGPDVVLRDLAHKSVEIGKPFPTFEEVLDYFYKGMVETVKRNRPDVVSDLRQSYERAVIYYDLVKTCKDLYEEEG